MKTPSDKHKKITAAKIIAGVAATAALCLNVNGCVYGPGAMPEDDETKATTQETTEETTDETTEETTFFNPDDNDNPDVYGPPEDFAEDNMDEIADIFDSPEASETSSAEN